MTPAPISVERLREVIAFLLGEGELDNRWFGDGSAPLVAGKYRAPYWWRTQLRETTDSLLHQLAERDAEVERLREYVREADRRVGEQFMAAQRAEAEALRLLNRCGEAFDRTRAAERAREEACEMLAWFANNPYAYRIMADKCSECAAFLAASGGGK